MLMCYICKEVEIQTNHLTFSFILAIFSHIRTVSWSYLQIFEVIGHNYAIHGLNCNYLMQWEHPSPTEKPATIVPMDDSIFLEGLPPRLKNLRLGQLW